MARSFTTGERCDLPRVLQQVSGSSQNTYGHSQHPTPCQDQQGMLLLFVASLSLTGKPQRTSLQHQLDRLYQHPGNPSLMCQLNNAQYMQGSSCKWLFLVLRYSLRTKDDVKRETQFFAWIISRENKTSAKVQGFKQAQYSAITTC